MSKNTQVGEVIVYPAKGGLESVSIPGLTTPGRLADGFNFIVDINGAKKKSPGAVRIDNRKNPIAPKGSAKGAYDFWRTSGSQKIRRTVLVASQRILADNGDGAYIDVTGGFSLFATDNVVMETFFGLLVMAFSNNASYAGVLLGRFILGIDLLGAGAGILKYDHSSSVSVLKNAPLGKYLRTWDNRLWIAGVGTAPDRLFGSVIDNPEDWRIFFGAIQINLDQGDQDPIGITSLFPKYYGRMLVSKRRSIYEVTPSGGTYAIRPIVEGLGCISHNGTASTDTDIIFPSERGVHSFAMTNKLGQIENSFLSAPIQNIYQEVVSFDRAENMQSIYIPEINSYILSLTSKSSFSNDYVFCYNFALGEWSIWRQNVSAIAKYVDVNDSKKTKVLILDDKGRVGLLDTTKSGRTVTWFDEFVTTQMTTGIIYPLGVRKDVGFKKLTIFFRPQSNPNSVLLVDYLVNGRYIEQLEFSMAANQGAIIGKAIIGVDKIGSGGVIKQVTRELKGHGSAIEIVMTHKPSAVDDDCELYGFIIEYEYSGETDQPRQQ